MKTTNPSQIPPATENVTEDLEERLPGRKNKRCRRPLSPRLGNRLSAYAAVGAAVAATAATEESAEGAVMYRDLNPDVVAFQNNLLGGFTPIDMDLDGVIDFGFFHTSYAGPPGSAWSALFGRIGPTNGFPSSGGLTPAGNGVGVFGSGPYNFPARLAQSVTLTTNPGNPGNPLPLAVSAIYAGMTTTGLAIGNFFNSGAAQTGYLGVTFDSNTFGSNLHGWIRVTVDPRATGITIHDLAFETSGAPIHVGTIPEPSALGFLAFGAAGLACLRRRRETKADSSM